MTHRIHADIETAMGVGKFLVSLISFLVIVLPVHSALAQEGLYWEFSQLPQSPLELNRAIQSTLKLELYSGSELISGCSGSFVSREGHILTALHCLRSCEMVSEKGQAQKWGSTRNDGLAEFFETKSRGDLICANMKIRGYENLKVKVVVLGRGQIVPSGAYKFSREFWKKNSAELNRLAEVHEDFAILKVDLLKAKASCIPLAKDEVKLHSPVWALGHPGDQVGRERPFLSYVERHFLKLDSLRITYGETSERLGRESVSWVTPNLDAFYRGNQFFVSNLDFLHGMSGGPVINDQGELRGLINEIHNEDSLVMYLKDAAVSLKSEYIFSVVERELGKAAAGSVFDCKL